MDEKFSIDSLKQLIANGTPKDALLLQQNLLNAIPKEHDCSDGIPSDLEEYCAVEHHYENLPGISVDVVDSVGGYEGNGEVVRRVFAISEGSKYKKAKNEYRQQMTKQGEILCWIACYGIFNSYEGTEWDDPEFVYPKQVTVTQYLPKEK
jgi:hypothetical protein